MSTSQLASSNIDSLQTAANLLATLPGDMYTTIVKPYFESSIGKHVRHIIDHYLCFQRDLSSATINYDNRHRDTRLELDKAHALQTIEQIQAFLAQLTGAEKQPLEVVMCQDVSLPEGEQTASSLARELLFLQGHTLHHFALIGVMLKVNGLSVDNDFGVAPSTLVHEQVVKASS